MQNELNIERSREGQQAQTLRIRPRWHMTVLHAGVLPHHGGLSGILHAAVLGYGDDLIENVNSEVMTTTPIMPPAEWTLEGYASAMEELGQPLWHIADRHALWCDGIGIPGLGVRLCA